MHKWKQGKSKKKKKLMVFRDAHDKELLNKLEESTSKRDAVREELKNAKSQLTKEKEELEALHKKLLKQEARAKKVLFSYFF